MFKSYLAHLELRVEAISKLIGSTGEFKEGDVKEVREGINEITVKLHKDNFRKCRCCGTKLSELRKVWRSTVTLLIRCRLRRSIRL